MSFDQQWRIFKVVALIVSFVGGVFVAQWEHTSSLDWRSWYLPLVACLLALISTFMLAKGKCARSKAKISDQQNESPIFGVRPWPADDTDGATVVLALGLSSLGGGYWEHGRISVIGVAALGWFIGVFLAIHLYKKRIAKD